jgi:hypothetical protein
MTGRKWRFFGHGRRKWTSGGEPRGGMGACKDGPPTRHAVRSSAGWGPEWTVPLTGGLLGFLKRPAALPGALCLHLRSRAPRGRGNFVRQHAQAHGRDEPDRVTVVYTSIVNGSVGRECRRSTLQPN